MPTSQLRTIVSTALSCIPANVSVGVTVASGPNFPLYARYDGILYTGNTSYQNVSAGLRWQF